MGQFLLKLYSFKSHFLYGNHKIYLSVAARNFISVKVEMSKTKAGQEFFNAIRK